MRQSPLIYQRTMLFDLMERQGRTQAWLARETGCSQSLISMMKSGSRRIPAWFAERASAAVGLPIEMLFFEPELSFDSETPAIDSHEESRSVA